MAFDKTKVDHNLGVEINKHLKKIGVETPMNGVLKRTNNQEKLDSIEIQYRMIMDELNLNLEDDSLKETPKRVAKMYVNEIFYGLDYKNFPKITPFENKMKYDEMIIEKNITVKSMCEHHIMPFLGHAYIGYIPNGTILGLSKLNRLVDFFSRRPQVQERLTEQVWHSLNYILQTNNIAVLIKANHLCVVHRGVEDENSEMITSKLGGNFKNISEVRTEFLNLVT